MPSTKSAAVIKTLRKLFKTHGLPHVIVSDNGTAFKSSKMKELLRLNAVRFTYIAPYQPASNGRAESLVREMKSALKKLTQVDTRCKILRFFLFKQHSTPHSDTAGRLRES